MRLLLLLTLVGCTASAGQRARTAGKGAVQVGLEGGASAGAVWPAPVMDLAVRVGVSERLDLGARVGSSGYEAQGKLRLTDDDSDLVVSAAILASYKSFGSACPMGGDCGSVNAQSLMVPVLVDIPTGPRSAVVVGPAGRYSYVRSPSGWGPEPTWLQVGGSLGYALSFGGSFTLLPQVGALPTVCCRGQAPIEEGSYDVRVAFLFGQRFDP